MEEDGYQRRGNGLIHWIRHNGFLFGMLSLIWFMLRTGRKPSRASYPCQRAALLNSQVWLSTYILPALSTVSGRLSFFSGRRRLTIAVLAIFAASVAASYVWFNPFDGGEEYPGEAVTTTGLNLTGRVAVAAPASDIFVVGETSGNDGGVERLLGLMGEHGLLFYESSTAGENAGPGGLIAGDDFVLIKVNCQWDERGGTNTDLLRALIQAILDHPDGFTGEILVADNGQAQYGSTGGNGGSLDWERNNAEDTSQSAQGVVDSFSGAHRVSTYLWDTITTIRVEEFSEGDYEDGYVVNTTMNPRTGVMVSYPKFMTEYGTYISFKYGIWDPKTGTYNGDGLKVINMPVLKTHSGYGVTACVKHYMGVPSDRLTRELGARTHNTIANGGMGTLMTETRFPALNILDCIWVNANPVTSLGSRDSGPSTPYEKATRVNVIAASLDPVALDHWAAKNVLMQVAPERHSLNSIDPDYDEPGFFGRWLRLSMDELVRAGHQATMDETRMNVYVANSGS